MDRRAGIALHKMLADAGRANYIGYVRLENLLVIGGAIGRINGARKYRDMPKVVNGESDLLVQLCGKRGRHTRAALGVVSLSRDSPVENEITVQVTG